MGLAKVSAQIPSPEVPLLGTWVGQFGFSSARNHSATQLRIWQKEVCSRTVLRRCCQRKHLLGFGLRSASLQSAPLCLHTLLMSAGKACYIWLCLVAEAKTSAVRF